MSKSTKTTSPITPMLVSQTAPSKVTWSLIMSALSASKQKKATNWVLREIKKQDSVDVETSISLRDDLYEMVSRFSSVGNSPEPFRAMLDQLVALYKREHGIVINPCKSLVGKTVYWKGAGKIARLEEKAGVVVSGKVVSETTEDVTVLPDHRVPTGARFSGMQASVPKSSLLPKPRLEMKPVLSVKEAAKTMKSRGLLSGSTKKAVKRQAKLSGTKIRRRADAEARKNVARAKVGTEGSAKVNMKWLLALQHKNADEASSESINRSLTRKNVLDALLAQQDTFMAERGLTKFKVEPKVLSRFARLAFKAFRRNLKACKNGADHVRLYKALLNQLDVNGRGFLKARHIAEIQ